MIGRAEKSLMCNADRFCAKVMELKWGISNLNHLCNGL